MKAIFGSLFAGIGGFDLTHLVVTAGSRVEGDKAVRQEHRDGQFFKLSVPDCVFVGGGHRNRCHQKKGGQKRCRNSPSGVCLRASAAFDLGFERAGLTCSWQVEIDPFCRKVLAKHWPHVRRYDDVQTFPPREVRAGLRENDPGAVGGTEVAGGVDTGLGTLRVDVICGGDPCQENSRARVTTGTTSPSLGAEFIRVVSVLRPTFVVRENPRHVRRDAPWSGPRFAAELGRIGYVAELVEVRACCFGFDHRRARLLVLAQRADAYRQPLWVPGRSQAPRPKGEVQGEARERQRLRLDPRAVVRDPRGGNDAGAGGVAHGVSRGVDHGRRLRACGNAVVPDVAEWVGGLVLNAIGGVG